VGSKGDAPGVAGGQAGPAEYPGYSKVRLAEK